MNVLLKTLSGYQRRYLRQDLLSGLVIAAVSIPISMGYAQIAGLPVVYGLYGSLLPILAFSLITACTDRCCPSFFSPFFPLPLSLSSAWTPLRRPWWAVWWLVLASP